MAFIALATWITTPKTSSVSSLHGSNERARCSPGIKLYPSRAAGYIFTVNSPSAAAVISPADSTVAKALSTIQ
ncbi:hypothetical protein HHJ39_00020 [Escherichia coli]|nr:hypothetical protein HHJ39_00020 [Escherichia coli]